MSGCVVAVVGPSGVGKDTLMHSAQVVRPDLHLIQRVITRPVDAGGEDFVSVKDEEFEQLRLQQHFILDWQAHGLRYGIPRNVEKTGISLVNLSRSVLPRAAEIFPCFRVIHVSATPEVLRKRLAARGREDADQIAGRISRAAPFELGPLTITNVDNSGALDRGLASFLAALDEMTP